jgi:SCP-2 sterol transfer family
MTSERWIATGRGPRGYSGPDAAHYLDNVEDILGETSDARMYARLDGLPGGVHGAVDIIATGLPAAFHPELSGGEAGAVLFVLEAERETIMLCVELRPDDCIIAAVPENPRTVITCSLAVFLKLVFKRLDGYSAYLDKQLKVTGDIVLAIGIGEWYDKPASSLADRIGVRPWADGSPDGQGGR